MSEQKQREWMIPLTYAECDAAFGAFLPELRHAGISFERLYRTAAESARALMSNGDDLLTVDETIQRLRVGRTIIHELVKRGELASITIGRRRLFPETAVAAFIQRTLEEAACS